MIKFAFLLPRTVSLSTFTIEEWFALEAEAEGKGKMNTELTQRTQMPMSWEEGKGWRSHDENDSEQYLRYGLALNVTYISGA